MSDHLDDDALSELLDRPGGLTASRRHVDGCAHCHSRLAAMAEAGSQMRAVPPAPPGAADRAVARALAVLDPVAAAPSLASEIRPPATEARATRRRWSRLVPAAGAAAAVVAVAGIVVGTLDLGTGGHGGTAAGPTAGSAAASSTIPGPTAASQASPAGGSLLGDLGTAGDPGQVARRVQTALAAGPARASIDSPAAPNRSAGPSQGALAPCAVPSGSLATGRALIASGTIVYQGTAAYVLVYQGPAREAVPGTGPAREAVPGTGPAREAVPGTGPAREAVPGTGPAREAVPGTGPAREAGPGKGSGGPLEVGVEAVGSCRLLLVTTVAP